MEGTFHRWGDLPSRATVVDTPSGIRRWEEGGTVPSSNRFLRARRVLPSERPEEPSPLGGTARRDRADGGIVDLRGHTARPEGSTADGLVVRAEGGIVDLRAALGIGGLVVRADGGIVDLRGRTADGIGGLVVPRADVGGTGYGNGSGGGRKGALLFHPVIVDIRSNDL